MKYQRIALLAVLSLLIAFLIAPGVNGDTICDSDGDRLCNMTDCTTSSGQAGKCVQRLAYCNCEPTNGKSIALTGCDGDTVAPGTIKLMARQMATFVLDEGCDGALQITGADPIGSFVLLPDEVVSILFTQPGTYNYVIEGGVGAGTIQVSQGIPSLSQYGISALIILLVTATLWVFRKKRVQAVA